MKETKVVIISLVALSITLAFLIYFIIISVRLDAIAVQSNLNIYSNANIYDTKFHDLMQENVFLMIMTGTRSLNSSAALNANYNALETNVREIAAQIANVYGTDVANQYIALQNNKINDFLNYTIAIRNGDLSADSVFAININNDEDAIASFWSNSTGLNSQVVKQLILERVNDEKGAMNYWYQEDYTDYFVELHNAYTNMGTYSDVIATAIIKQNPGLFQ
jgi:hypothetical protein